MGDKGRVAGVADDYSADAFGPAVGVKGVSFDFELVY